MSDDQVENSSATEVASRKTTWALVIIIAIAIIAAAIWWWLPSEKPSQQETVVVEQSTSSEVEVSPIETEEPTTDPDPLPEPVEPEPEQTEPVEEKSEPEPVALPELNNSTPTVLQELDSDDINIRPLKSSQIIRDAVVLADNISNGSIVRDRTIVQRPDGRFSVIKVDGQLYIDDSSYRRYDALVDWVVSLDAHVLAKNYEMFKPLVQEAYSEIGYPESDFNDTLNDAIKVLLSTPVPEGLVEVKADSVMYTYANDAYETLPAAQKQLLRMGPDNIKRLKEKLKEIQRALQ